MIDEPVVADVGGIAVLSFQRDVVISVERARDLRRLRTTAIEVRDRTDCIGSGVGQRRRVDDVGLVVTPQHCAWGNARSRLRAVPVLQDFERSCGRDILPERIVPLRARRVAFVAWQHSTGVAKSEKATLEAIVVPARVTNERCAYH